MASTGVAAVGAAEPDASNPKAVDTEVGDMANGLLSPSMTAPNADGDGSKDRSEGDDTDDDFWCCTRVRMTFPAAANELAVRP